MGSVSDTARRLDAMLVALGLTRKPVVGGISYKQGRATLCRIDPKADFLRVQVGDDHERMAPAALRGPYIQRGWLVVRPADGELAEGYIRRSIEDRLQS